MNNRMTTLGAVLGLTVCVTYADSIGMYLKHRSQTHNERGCVVVSSGLISLRDGLKGRGALGASSSVRDTYCW